MLLGSLGFSKAVGWVVLPWSLRLAPTFPMGSLPELDLLDWGQAGVFAAKLSSEGFSVSSAEAL